MSTTYRRYYPILRIPEGKLGRFAVLHVHRPAGTTLKLASFRTAYNGQPVPKEHTIHFPMDTIWHQLTESGGVWMTDDPIEQHQHNSILRGFSGHVLVGGLGLGYAVTRLAFMPKVKTITVIERYQNVISLVWPYLAKAVHTKSTVVRADLFKWLKAAAPARPFDYGFYDIWQSDSEDTFHHTVVPLRQLSHGKVQQVRCWNEDVMRGQLLRGIESRFLLLANPELRPDGWQDGRKLEDILLQDHSIYQRWAKPFWERALAAKDGREWPNPKWLREAQKYVLAYGMRP
jgi:hypothetical protein